MSAVTWLHLSDWHQRGKDFDREVVRDALLKDIEERKSIDPALEKIDFIVFSGDAAQNGKKEEYEAAVKQLFNPVLSATNLTPEQLFIVPGNHDLDRERFEDLPSALEKPFTASDTVIKWLDVSKRSKILEPFFEFSSFMTNYTGQKSPCFADSRIFTTESGICIRLAGFNSALMCGRNKVGDGVDDQHQLIIGEPQVREAVAKNRKEILQIAVLHHSFDFLAEFDRTGVEADIKRQFHFILHGHTHRPEVHRITGTMGDFVIIPAGACYNRRLDKDPNYINSYNFVRIDLEEGRGKVFLRKWDETQKGWWKLDARTSPGGVFSFELPKALIGENVVPVSSQKTPVDPKHYLTALLNECKSIDIRGLKVSDANARRLDIEELYTPLHITGSIEELDKKAEKKSLIWQNRPEKVTLDAVLRHQAAVIIGDPGAGKSTFLKRIVTILARTYLNEDSEGSKKKLGLDPAPLPIFIRLFDLAKHIERCQTSYEQNCPVGDDNPAWLFHYLDRMSNDRRFGLSREWFEQQSDSVNGVIILLDGLDESPDTRSRDNIVRLVNKLRNDCKRCRFVVTSRPVAYDEGLQLNGFFRCDIAPLDDDGVTTFLRQWCGALYYDTPESATKHFEVLKHDVFARVAIRRLAANPVMLTALSVLHWNNKKLPEQRAELYESVIGWLLDSRDLKRPGRTNRDECREHLQAIALAMQEWKGGRQQSLERGEMIDLLSGMMNHSEEKKRRLLAERFIENEELDSGIIRARGNRVEFWHLTFLEYLAARELAGLGEESQRKILLKREIVDNPAWRETLLLFIGVLWNQGRKKVDGFFTAMLDHMEQLCKATIDGDILTREAQCFGLMGAMLRDLQPYAYSVGDHRFEVLKGRVDAIFDGEKAKSISIKVRISAADALGQAGDHRIVEDLRIEAAKKRMFIEIPEGKFLMGAQKTNLKGDNYDTEMLDNESPVHYVHLDAFKICRYPVTVSQYELFVNDNGYEREEFWIAGKEGYQTKPEAWEQQVAFPNRPVIGVSWFESMAFCQWAGLQLPTEAQWERAVRGPKGKNMKSPWGNEAIDVQRANYCETNTRSVSPVGCFPYGNVVWDANKEVWLADMVGNVYEWCIDRYGEYSAGLVKNPKGNDTGSGRVFRGGSWFSGAWSCRCADRRYDDPRFRAGFVGFRVVLVP